MVMGKMKLRVFIFSPFSNTVAVLLSRDKRYYSSATVIFTLMELGETYLGYLQDLS